MKVWEMIAKLSKCQADANVWIAAGNYNLVPAETAEYDDTDDPPEVRIESSCNADPH
ncbi:MAG: hypothetical protein WBC44_05870 [Planctomycetaceae bacterium]